MEFKLSEKFNSDFVMKGLRKMKELRFLIISWDFWHDNKRLRKYASPYLPNALQYLHWYECPLWSLPNTFQGNNLVALKMAHSNITQLWDGGERKVLNKLKILDLSCSKLTTLDLGLIPNLEVLSLGKCGRLVQLHMLDGCRKLISVKISSSYLKTIDLRSAVNLELLHIEHCSALVELQMPGKCVNLEDLDLNHCYNFEDLHMADKCLKLISLNISHSKLKNLDLGLTPNLKKLDVQECHNLVQVHVPIGCLENFDCLVLGGCLRFISFKIEKRDESLEVGPLAELHLIAKSLQRCPLHPDNTSQKFQFECFFKDDPSLIRKLETHISIGMCACTCTKLEIILKSICELRRLRKLIIEDYPEAPKELDLLECLEELSLFNTRMKHLPDGICMLKHLKILELQSSSRLEKLPEDLAQLECLERLTLSSPKINHLPDSICMLKHLMYLELKSCFLIEKLPEDLGRLECLEELYLSYTKIKHLPDTICMLKQLKVLVLHRCSLLEKLPDDLGLVGRLVTLALSSSKIKHLPDTICMLKDLKELRLNDCSLLEKLREDICLLKGLRIWESRELIQSYGFTSEIQTRGNKYSCYVDV